jgi:16S rRNA (guanine527-N7)-methyltransferase
LAGSYELISSRAFASLPDFFNGSKHLLAPAGIWLAMKGKVPDDELAELPTGIDVFHVEQLNVPWLDAERCIVWARKPAS